MEDPRYIPKRCWFPLRHALISALTDLDVRGIRRIAHHLPGLLVPEPREACIMKTLHGFWLWIDPVRDEGVERSIYYTGTYEKGALAIMKHILNEGDVFVDGGANIGLMSLFASPLVGPEGKVYAFEPNPETAGILQENIRINNAENIEVSEFALGKGTGEARIYNRWDFNRGSATLIRPEKESGSFGISITSLSEFFHREQEIHLLKLDIEGYELEALEGAAEILQCDNPPMLIIECSGNRKNSSDGGTDAMFDFLNELSRYKIFRSSKGKGRVSKLLEVKSRNDMPFHDNIYCFCDSHKKSIRKGIFATPPFKARQKQQV